MSIDWQRDTQINITDEEEQQIHTEFDTVKVKKHHGRLEKLHIYDCAYLKENPVETREKDIACYPPGWTDICTVCLLHYREGGYESLD